MWNACENARVLLKHVSSKSDLVKPLLCMVVYIWVHAYVYIYIYILYTYIPIDTNIYSIYSIYIYICYRNYIYIWPARLCSTVLCLARHKSPWGTDRAPLPGHNQVQMYTICMCNYPIWNLIATKQSNAIALLVHISNNCIPSSSAKPKEGIQTW